MPDRPVETFAGASGLLWRSVADEAAWLRDFVAARPEALLELPGAVVVKENPVRRVVRLPREGRPALYLKQFHLRKWGDRLRYLVTASPAEVEWRISRGMQAAGLPVVDVVAAAEARTAGVLTGAMLAVREIPDALELVPWFFHRFPGHGPWAGEEAFRRRAVLVRLGEVVRRMHDAGFVHPDLHGGNLLLGKNDPDPAVTIIDLHKVRRRDVVDAGTREEDLAKLLHSTITATSHADRARVIRAYEGSGSPLLPGPVFLRIEARIRALEETRVRGRTRAAKLLGASGRFDVDRGDGRRMVFLRKWGRAPFDEALRRHAAVPDGSPDLLKKGGRSRVTRVTVDGPAGRVPLIVKETRVRGAMDVLKNAVRPPRAVRGWFGGNGLFYRHLEVAIPRAVIVRGRWPLLCESFLVMEDVTPDGERFDLRALRLWGEGPLDADARRRKRAEAFRFGRYVGDLHARGIYHGDLKAVNVFVREKFGRTLHCLIDYDRVEFGTETVGERRRIKNLAQLAASVGTYLTRTDRLRFLSGYATRVRGAWEARRVLAEGVARASARKIVVTREPIE